MNRYIDVIYYINLDHRTDRNEQFLEEMRKMEIDPEKIVRIPAIRRDHGDVGCSLSHAKTVELFLQSPHQNCLILEDDFTFTVDKDGLNDTITKFFEKGIVYDVCQFSANAHPQLHDHPDCPFIKYVGVSSCASGYMISKKFAKVFLDNIKEGVHLLETECYAKNNIPLKFEYAIDSHWKLLQGQNSQWFIFWPKLGKQRASWSDIQNNFEDYNT